ncbi:BTAD domain-containing putative transcriptional regulator [Nonomuraea sp. NEAU-A123]|uniref:AfsR/SARP family transcriptional regulator n=1 Tax=Nonomuraea sp. NEAU-A123 TaxID=2839649 RepID=UPI001BE4B9BA|nr:BTAD domain-containing putative transcriptional regulator [Nonomuraea sp. NEAU-A123]MBT2235769.1 tetratricopeptide repeat protein [Nonomuraea sp. NEAU-A123]
MLGGNVRFAILGAVEVSAEGRELPSLAPRHRAFLGYLLLHSGTVLSVERLIEAMWGPTPPDTARAQVHAALTAMRRTLRAADAAHLVQTRSAGYLITPAAGQLDLQEFATLVAEAQSEPAPAVQTLRQALALWRGPAFAGVQAHFAESARARLEDRRLAAVERLVELELAAGRHAELIDQLAAELAAHPLRERLAGQLMLALHRAGRQADALAVGRDYRRRLADEQGLDPGHGFLAIEETVLRGEPPAATPIRSARAEPPAAALIRPAQAGPPDAATARPVAAFLPYDVADFAGRSVQVEELCGPASQTVTISVIDGMAGIGKTALAVHAAHRLAGRYPDGQLFIDLHAHTAGQRPLEPAEALEVLLRQLGVATERIPASMTERAALWRAELAGRRVLLVLDNAADAAQIRPLLPGASNSLVLITSRQRLTDLDGARAVSMDVLPLPDAVALFTGIVGERAVAESEAVAEVLLLCGFLPLAVRIAATRLRHRPRWSVAHLAERLRDERRRLTELARSERGVAAAFTLSYRQLTVEQQQVFRLLGLHPGRDIEPHAAAALADLPVERTEDLLEDLLDAHMLQQRAFGRYVFHDLLRQYAAQLAAEQEPPQAGEAAMTRLLGHQLTTASDAMDLLYPDSAHRRPRIERSACPPVPVHDAPRALAWLEAERANLVLAADRDLTHTGLLATTLFRYLYDHAHHDDALALYGKALHAARCREDLAGEGRALTDLGWVHQVQGSHDVAREHFDRALAACGTAEDLRGQARALVGLGRVGTDEGDHERAKEANLRALELFRDIGDRFGEAVTLDYLGIAHERLGQYAQAADLHRQALELSREIGSRGGEADALDNLGVACTRLGRHAEARDHHEQALELYRHFGYRRGEAKALNSLAEIAATMGDPGKAVHLHTTALDLAVELSNRSEERRAREALARLLPTPETCVPF